LHATSLHMQIHYTCNVPANFLTPLIVYVPGEVPMGSII
jgi:hypothetical protein